MGQGLSNAPTPNLFGPKFIEIAQFEIFSNFLFFEKIQIFSKFSSNLAKIADIQMC